MVALSHVWDSWARPGLAEAGRVIGVRTLGLLLEGCGGGPRGKRNTVERERIFSWESISFERTCMFSPQNVKKTELICSSEPQICLIKEGEMISLFLKSLKFLQLGFPHTWLLSDHPKRTLGQGLCRES